ncbi:MULTISPECIES: alpha/beta fold hydrolase [unclassified Streptomyces]|uniref:esterase/lipase family protein n=1 Tax=unclassified Streptomyces TaxID=2593676 RepID=UPI000368FECF|nr:MULTISPECIES: alpha/beta fold hydrolase [unclassified Streptomyces]MYT29748.1 alpha/beta fold hydrolase [Streptomyces sp. SID8354]
MKLRWPRLRAVLPASALVIGLATATPAAAAPTVSSGWNDLSCKPSAAHPRPVVLAHGTLGNSVDNWLGLAPYLVARGYCVFSLDYGQLPGVPLFHGLGPVDASARQLAVYVDQVRSATGAAKVDIVGHSQGAMMSRVYMKFHGGADKVDTLVGLAPTNHGTTLSGLTKLLDLFPGARKYIDEHAQGLTDQAVGSALLNRLNAGGDTLPGVHYTVITTKYDEVATPYTTGYLNGPDVHNVRLQDLCAVDLSEHVAIGTVDRIAFHETANALDPAHATPSNCLSAAS